MIKDVYPALNIYENEKESIYGNYRQKTYIKYLAMQWHMTTRHHKKDIF